MMEHASVQEQTRVQKVQDYLAAIAARQNAERLHCERANLDYCKAWRVRMERQKARGTVKRSLLRCERRMAHNSESKVAMQELSESKVAMQELSKIGSQVTHPHTHKSRLCANHTDHSSG
jgi:hypothetical protein